MDNYKYHGIYDIVKSHGQYIANIQFFLALNANQTLILKNACYLPRACQEYTIRHRLVDVSRFKYYHCQYKMLVLSLQYQDCTFWYIL